MSKYDVHVLSVPNHHAQLVVARLMLASDRTLTMQAAMDLAAKPPVMLFKNISHKEAEEHAAHLKSLGIECMIAELPPESAPPPTVEQDLGEYADIREHNAAHTAYSELPTITGHHAKSAGDGGHTVLHTTSGVLIGSLDESKIEEAERSAAKKNMLISIVLVCLIVLFGAIMYLLPKGGKFAVKKSAPVMAGDKRSAQTQTKQNARSSGGQTAHGSGAHEEGSQENRRASVSGGQKQQASAYVDSARSSGGELEKRVAFYRAAISFNRYNHAAWHGLLQAYIDLQMHAEARETEERMAEIFGGEITSVGSMVNKTFGELSDAYRHSDGAYNVEYRSRKHGRDEILRDIFNMTRIVRSVCACRDISIRAVTPSGGEMTVRTTGEVSAHSFSEFTRLAEVRWSGGTIGEQ